MLTLTQLETIKYSNTQARVLTSSEVNMLIGINGQCIKSIDSANKRGEVCWVIMDKELLTAYVWISAKSIHVHSDTAYIFPVATLYYW